MPTKTTFLFVLLISITGFATGQADKPEFVSGVARFAIRVGDTSPRISPGFSQTDKFHLPSETFVWADGELAISVTHFSPLPFRRNSIDGLTNGERTELQRLLEGQLTESIKDEDASVQRTPYARSGAIGTEYLIAGRNRSVVRIFFIRDRLYLLLARKLGLGEFDLQKKALDTFRYLPDDEFVEATLRENTPAELPQTVPNGILPTDAIEQNLKGRVYEIIEDVESGTPKKRERNLIEVYNSNGHLIKQITYAGGRPDIVSMYGWVDGNRAVNAASINYRGEGWKGIGSSKMIVGQGAPEGMNFIGRDLSGKIVDRRYTTRFELKYDDEWRVTERVHLTSAGDISLIEKITYNPRGRDIKTEDQVGGFISRKLQVFDANGSVTEEYILDDRGGKNSGAVFKYEFDAKGNWVVKKVYFKQKGRAGALKHTSTYYRTIKYFEN